MVRSNWAENTRRMLDSVRPEETVVLLPVGAVEQHGNHLPVETDALIADQLVRKTAENTGQALALPVLSYGYSPHHRGAAGTITLSSDTYLGIISDILESLVDDGFQRIAIVNGHGGNRSLLKTAVSDFRDEHGVSIALVSYWDLIADIISEERDSELGGVSHGGEMETSLLLYLREELVGDERDNSVRDNRDGYLRTDLFGTSTVYYPIHFDEMTVSGSSGTPSDATSEKGARFFETAVEELGAFVESYRDW